jgi:glycosyltransferase involved in cell wall biosynthesis
VEAVRALGSLCPPANATPPAAGRARMAANSGMGAFEGRVCHLLVGFTVGGVENQLLRILPRLGSRGMENVVCGLKGWGPMAEEFRGRGIRAVALGGRGKGDARVLGRLTRFLRRENVAILHCYTSRANWAGCFAAKMAGVPLVVLSDRELRTWMRPWHRWWDRWCFRIARGMTVPSDAVKRWDVEELGLDADRIWVIPNGVELDRFAHPRPREEARQRLGLDAVNGPLIGYVGRLEEPVKGLGYLLSALAQLRGDDHSPRLLVVGEGHARGRLEATAMHLGLREWVRFAGLRKDVPELMGALDLLVVPSLREGCPNVVLEAMAAGLPVVATGVGGTPEIIQHGVTGWLVTPGDSTELAQGIDRMLRHPDEARALARAARTWVERYGSIERTAEALDRLYDCLWNSAPHGQRRPQ